MKTLIVYLADNREITVPCASAAPHGVWIIALDANGSEVARFKTGQIFGYKIEESVVPDDGFDPMKVKVGVELPI